LIERKFVSVLDEVGSSSKSRYVPRVGVMTLPEKSNLSNRQRAYLDIAVRLAESSDTNFKHGAVIVRGGSVMAVGVNKWKNRDIFVSDPTDYNPHITVHAEVDALSRVKDAHGATIYIARVTKAGEERFSRPCERCEKVLISAGVKRVVYTTG
jgi:deoxycytidylate deaminase